MIIKELMKIEEIKRFCKTSKKEYPVFLKMKDNGKVKGFLFCYVDGAFSVKEQEEIAHSNWYRVADELSVSNFLVTVDCVCNKQVIHINKYNLKQYDNKRLRKNTSR